MSRILLLSAYDAISHQRWRKGLVHAFPENEWTVLTLPPRYFNWRIRGNSLSWAFDQREVLTQGYDLLVTTSMCDLSTLRGLVPELSKIPTVIYFHENQFAYPDRVGNQQKTELEPKVVSMYSALAADQVIFNSAWNRDSFLQGVEQFLKTMPDHVPEGVIKTLSDKSSVVPVPLDKEWFYSRAEKTRSDFTILWNHRWEYDKAPERFLKALVQLKQQGVKFKINLVGQQFRQIPAIFDQMKDQLVDHISQWGYLENESDYRTIMRNSDVVVSSALHDFQGLAILEAVASGCIPVVPDRLAYPEFFAEEFRFPSFVDDPDKEISFLVKHLSGRAEEFSNDTLPDAPNLNHLEWANMKAAYRAKFDL